MARGKLKEKPAEKLPPYLLSSTCVHVIWQRENQEVFVLKSSVKGNILSVSTVKLLKRSTGKHSASGTATSGPRTEPLARTWAVWREGFRDRTTSGFWIGAGAEKGNCCGSRILPALAAPEVETERAEEAAKGAAEKKSVKAINDGHLKGTTFRYDCSSAQTLYRDARFLITDEMSEMIMKVAGEIRKFLTPCRISKQAGDRVGFLGEGGPPRRGDLSSEVNSVFQFTLAVPAGDSELTFSNTL
ncbi:hypothetical protein ACRRTK_004637 [Alexandromys fortis]